MAETANIAKIAEKLSNELFSEFLWARSGPVNSNWTCEDQKKHKGKTHPSDVVFFYDEPYAKTRTYVNCDLKSYSKSSIKAQVVISAIESLARAVTCAEKSEEWRKLYIHNHVSPEICGLLFVYNHDGEYDKDFSSYLSALKHDKLDLPKGSKIIVLGPADIFWLDNVRLDITLLRGQGKVPDKQKCRFHYPHLVQRANLQLQSARAANLEMLTAPWIILEHGYESVDHGFIIYYRRNGDDVGEFLYLIDYLKHYQLLQPSVKIVIKTLTASAIAHPTFNKAVQQYSDECGSDTPIATLLHAISFESMTKIVSTFSDIELGMQHV
jgi:hypothetical protein